MEMALKITWVAIGGACGAVARYLINVSPLAGLVGKFPLPTFLINVIGCFLIGLCLIVLADKWDVSENMRLTIIVGFLGAFTTFSTFEAEMYGLMNAKDFAVAFAYMGLSLLVGFAGVLAGVALGRRV